MKASASGPVGLGGEGAIQGGTPFRLYAAHAAREATGWLRLWDARGKCFEIGFRKGNPEFLRTDDPELSQDRFLLAKGLVRAEDLQGLTSPDGRWIELAVTRGLLAPADAYQHLTSYYRGLLARSLLITSGRYAWEESPLPGGGLRLGDRWALLTSIGRRIPFESLEARLGERIGLPVRRAPSVPAPWESLGLSAVELRALGSIDGERSLAEIVAAAPDQAHAILRLGCFLGDAGFLLFGAEEKVEAPPAPQAAEEPSADLESLRQKLEELEGKNLFQRLGVPTDAPPRAIRNAYLKLARQFHPDLGGARGEIRALRAKITALLNEAHDILGNPQSRQAYVEELRSGGTEKVDVSSILEAERKLHMAIAMVRDRRFAEAAAVLDEALAIHDGEAELWAYRAYVRLAAATDREAAKAGALSDLERARALGERSSVVFLLSARIANLLGDGAAAIRYYERCLELEPGHEEAARELRILRSRRS